MCYRVLEIKLKFSILSKCQRVGACFQKDIAVSKYKYHKQDQQGKAVYNERSLNTTQQQEPVARSPEGIQTKTGQGARKSMGRLITIIIHKKN
jgi:hypothetical protein